MLNIESFKESSTNETKLHLKIQKQNFLIKEDTNFTLPNKLFHNKFSDYFLDLFNKDFNFNPYFLNYLDKNSRFLNFRQQTKERTHYSLLEFAILCNFTKIFSQLTENFSQSSDIDTHYFLLLLLESGNFDIFKKFMGIFFADDTNQIFEFILNSDLLMKMAAVGNERFLIAILQKYIVPLGNKKLIPENKLVFWTTRNEITYKNMNLFHYIAIYRMKTFMFLLLEYFLSFKFENDAKKMKYFLEDLLLMKNEEFSNINSSNVQKKSPVYYAIANKMYELIYICFINEIPLTNANDRESVLNDLGLLQQKLSYFSRFLFQNQNNFLVEIKKPNYFYEKFEFLLICFNKIKEKLASFASRKAKKSKKTHKKVIKKPKFHTFTAHYLIEALIFGSKILEIDAIFLQNIRFFLKNKKEKFSLLLFFQVFPQQIKELQNITDFLIPNEAFLLFFFDKFITNPKKNSETFAEPLEICKKLHKSFYFKNNLSEIVVDEQFSLLFKDETMNIYNTKNESKMKLETKDLFKILHISIENHFKYLLCYLMHLYPTEFLMPDEMNSENHSSFFLDYLSFDAHLAYRLLKILEKSSVFLILEKEFAICAENFFNFQKENNNLKFLIENFKVFLLLICEEGYYSQGILQASNSKNSEEALLNLFRKLIENIGNIRLLKNYLDTFAKELKNLDYCEVLNYEYFEKNNSKQEIMIRNIKVLVKFLLKEYEKNYKNHTFDVSSFENFVYLTIESNLQKNVVEYKHIGIFVSCAISFILTCLEGYGVYEDLSNEFNDCKFIYFFEQGNEGYSLLKQENEQIYKIIISQTFNFDINNITLYSNFNHESYEKLKDLIKENKSIGFFYF